MPPCESSSVSPKSRATCLAMEPRLDPFLRDPSSLPTVIVTLGALIPVTIVKKSQYNFSNLILESNINETEYVHINSY